MGITDFFSDMMSSLSFPEVHAEAPEKDDEEDSKDEGEDKEEGKGGDDEKEEGGDKGGDDEKEGGGDDAEEEEEEEEDEPVDPKPRLEEECANSAQCSGYKHHFDECVERVTAQHENPEHKGHKEDCVEEFFHLQHCATQCAAPKLFKQLK